MYECVFCVCVFICMFACIKLIVFYYAVSFEMILSFYFCTSHLENVNVVI